MAARALACFVGHPAPERLDDPADATARWLARLGAAAGAAAWRGVVAIGPGFEATRPTVTTSHDVGLARRVLEQLLAGGHSAAVDDRRAVEAFPVAIVCHLAAGARLPVVQLALHTSLDPELHLAVGRALEPLRDEGFAIVGCGALTRDAPREASRARARGGVTGTFDEWVVDLLTRTGPYARSRGLARFRDHPEAHRAQPRGEHVLPLVVVAGAATSDRSADNVGELSHSTAATVAADGRPIGGALGLVFRR